MRHVWRMRHRLATPDVGHRGFQLNDTMKYAITTNDNENDKKLQKPKEYKNQKSPGGKGKAKDIWVARSVCGYQIKSENS